MGLCLRIDRREIPRYARNDLIVLSIEAKTQGKTNQPPALLRQDKQKRGPTLLGAQGGTVIFLEGGDDAGGKLVDLRVGKCGFLALEGDADEQ